MTELKDNIATLNDLAESALVRVSNTGTEILDSLIDIDSGNVNNFGLGEAETLFGIWKSNFIAKMRLTELLWKLDEIDFHIDKDTTVNEMVVTELWEAMKLDYDNADEDEICNFSKKLIQARDEVTIALIEPSAHADLVRQLEHSCFLYAINWLECRR